MCPENAEEYVEYLVSIDRLDEAALRMADIVNQEDFVSKEGKSNHQVSDVTIRGGAGGGEWEDKNVYLKLLLQLLHSLQRKMQSRVNICFVKV